jgi:hypothetical protein
MTVFYDHIIITPRSVGRCLALANHRCKRVAKKWSKSLVLRHVDRIDPAAVLGWLAHMRRLHVITTHRADKQIARFLRRSGQRITVVRV